MRIREQYKLTEKHLPGLNPVGYGQEECAPGFCVNVPRPYWMLHFIVSGKGKFSTGNATYDVGPSQIFVVHPHQAHLYVADANDPWHYMWVQFDCEIEPPALLGTDVITAPLAGRIFTDCLAATNFTAGKEEYLDGKLWELMSLFHRLASGKPDHTNPYVARAKRYIEENYMHGIKVTDIAKDLNLDRSYFSTIFKRQTGFSPQQYLSEYRLERAAHLLAEENGTVASAAYLAGYSDTVNFSRMFKKHFGIAPNHYREMLRRHEEAVLREVHTESDV